MSRVRPDDRDATRLLLHSPESRSRCLVDEQEQYCVDMLLVTFFRHVVDGIFATRLLNSVLVVP